MMKYRIEEKNGLFTIECLATRRCGFLFLQEKVYWNPIDTKGKAFRFIHSINKSYKSLKKARKAVKIFQNPIKYHKV